MEDLISRRGIFTVSYQAEGICQALRLMVQSGATPGPETRTLVSKLLSDFRRLVASGPVADGIPDITESTTAADLLCIAETLRTSALCFLSPDEQEERKTVIGFNSSK